jgi:hypothetical protein
MHWRTKILTIFSVVVALTAAGLWFWSSAITIPPATWDDVGQPGTFLNAIRLSAQINKCAAATTGLSVLMSFFAKNRRVRLA